MSAQNEKRIVELVINGRSAEVSLNQVKKELIALTREFQKLKEADDPKLYAKKRAELKQLTETYKDMRGQVTGATKDMHDHSRGFMDNIKMIAAGSLVSQLIMQAWMGATTAIKNSIQMVVNLSDELTDIEKTSNLSAEAVAHLNDELGGIDTRTGRKELREMAVEAGKLGETSEAGILDFVQKADMINVALSELGKEGVVEIAKLARIFNEDMLDIGSAINSIGQASVATEPYQVDFLKRTSAIGKAVGLGSKELLGYGAALEINGVTAEISGTALNNFFGDFIKNLDDFERVSGMAKGSLRKLLDEKGTNGAFISFLEHLKLGSKDTDDLLKKLEDLKIDGARGSAAILTLAQNTSDIIEQQKVAMDSSGSIVTEFNKRNNNAAAVAEKAWKKFMALIMPVMQNIGGAFIGLLVIVTNSMGAILGFVKVLTVATVAMISYKAAVWLAAGGLKNLAVSIYSTIVPMNLQRIAALANATIMALLRGETIAAALSFRLLTTAMMANPFGLIVGAIAAGVTMIGLFTKEVELTEVALTGVKKATEDTAISYGKEQKKLLELLNTARDVRKSKEEQLAAIEALNKISPEYLGNITAETVHTDKAREAIDKYLESFNNKIMAQALEEAYIESTGKLVKAELEYQKVHDRIMAENKKHFVDQNGDRVKNFVDSQELIAKSAVTAAEYELREIKKLADKKKIVLGADVTVATGGTGTNYESEAERKAREKKEKEAKADIKKGLKEKKDAFTLEIEATDQKYKQLEAIASDARLKELRDEDSFQKGKKKLGTEALNAKSKELLDEQRFLSEKNRLELDALREKAKITEKYGKETGEINKKIADKEMDIIKDRQKYEELAFENEYDLAIQYNQQLYDALETDADLRRADGKLTKLEYEAELEDIELRKLMSRLKIQEDYGKSAVEIETAIGKKRVEAREKWEKNPLGVEHKGSFSGENQLGPTNFDKDTGKNSAERELTDEQKKNLKKANMALDFANQANDLANTMHQIEMNRMQTELNEYTRGQNVKKDSLDKRLKKGLISQEKYDDELAQLNAETKEREDAIKMKAYENQREADKTQALVNGALAITSILAQYPKFDGGIAMTAALVLAAGTTAAQIIKIESEPLPQFYGGGRTVETKTRYIENNTSDSSTVFKFLKKGDKAKVVGEQDGKEYNATNVGSLKNGGKYSTPSYGLIAEKGPELVIPNYIYSNPKYANVMQGLEAAIFTRTLPQFVMGGRTDGGVGDNSSSTDNRLAMALEANNAIMQKLNERLDKPIVAKTLFNRQRYDEYVELEDEAVRLGTF